MIGHGSVESEPEAQPHTSRLQVGWEKDQHMKLAKDRYEQRLVERDEN